MIPGASEGVLVEVAGFHVRALRRRQVLIGLRVLASPGVHLRRRGGAISVGAALVWGPVATGQRPQARYQAQVEDRVLQRLTTLRNEEPEKVWTGPEEPGSDRVHDAAPRLHAVDPAYSLSG